MGYTQRQKLSINSVDLSDNTTVNAGANKTETLQPNAGKIYQIIGLYVSIADPSGSTSGTHELRIKYQNNNTYIQIKATTGNIISVNQNLFTGDSAEKPSGTAQQFEIMYYGILYASYDQPLDFEYYNDTDANQTGTRTIQLIVKEVKEVG